MTVARVFSAIAVLVSVTATGGPPDPALDCALRALLLTTANARLASWPASANVSTRVHDALRLGECSPALQQTRELVYQPPAAAASADVFVSSVTGDDSSDGSTLATPLRTLHAAQDRVRSLRASGISRKLQVSLSGTFHLTQSLTLDGPGDADTTWSGPAVISGGIPLSNLKWVPSATYPAPVLDAQLPEGAPTSGIFALFDGDSGRRLPLAREPNGDPETMLQPIGWALARGNVNGTLRPPGGTQFSHVEVGALPRNNSVFPIWGRDFDPRNVPAGYVWFGEGSGGAPSLFEGNRSFWANKTIEGGLRWNATGGVDPHSGLPASPFSATGWATRAPGRRAHVFHNALWGGWVYDIDAVDEYSQTMTFSSGGWQEGRGGGIGTQPFFVEGEQLALDAPGEWWVNRATGVLSLWPNNTNSGPPHVLILPVLETVITIAGVHATGIELRDLTFAHTTDGLMEPYTVPAAGDWSLRRSAAVVVDGAQGSILHQCSWQRVNGNGLLVTNAARDVVVDGCDFYLPGGSAIAVVGYIPRANASDASAAFPVNVTISQSLAEGVGVIGKQTSALFISLACNVTLRDSVLFSGPRAGVNINDGFCGGHSLERNVIFDWVRETQDHGEELVEGPINTWDRQLYRWGNGDLAAGWNRITGNAVFNGPSGNRDLGNLFPAVDNDDGSTLYWTTRNLLYSGGAKNYLGHNKVWDSNLIVFPNRWSNDPCLCAWGGSEHVYTNNTCVTSGDYPLSIDSDVAGDKCIMNYSDPTSAANLPFLARNTYHTATGAYHVGCDTLYTLPQLQALGQELGSIAVAGYVASDIVQQASSLLGV